MLVVPLKQLRNYEGLGLKIPLEGGVASRFVGMCVLHGNVGTIPPSGPLSAIAARIRLLRFVWFFGGAKQRILSA